MSKNDRRINVILFVMTLLTIGWGYASGDWEKLSLHHGNAAATQQRALDHLFGSDDVAFDPAADDVSSYAGSPNDNLKWRELAQARTQEKHNILSVSYAPAVKKMDGHTVAITGYIFPLKTAERQSRFLLSAYPPSCPYCLPAGPSELIEVSDSDVPFTYKPVTVRGTFHAVQEEDDLRNGVYYRMSEAEQIR